ncbi:hypothetical protein Q3G72_016732 [Acer saccharum]|nr:hypothetical protein Q3G72_016732 [Acer saccharum]
MGRPETSSSSYLPQQQPQNYQSEYEPHQPQEYQQEAISTGDHEAALTYESNNYVQDNQCQPQQQPMDLQAQQQLQLQPQPQQQQQTNQQAYGAQKNNQMYQHAQINQPAGTYPPQKMQPQPVQFPPPSPQNNNMYQTRSPVAYPPQQGAGQTNNAVNFPPTTAQDFPPGQGVQFQQGNGQQYVQGFPVQRPTPQHTSVIASQKAAWSSGLFDCMNDPMNAVITALFPCLTFGQVAEIIDEGHTSCGTSGMLYGAIAFFIAVPCIMSCTYRTKLRNKFGLPEAPAPDWITHFLCEWCALCQEYRELQLRGWDPTIGWQGNVARNQPQVSTMPPMNQRMMG